MPNPYRKYLKTTLERREIRYPDTATIYDIQGDHADIRIGKSPNILHYIPIVGNSGTISIGQIVSIRWEERSGSLGKVPVIIPLSNSTGESFTYNEMIPDNITIEFSSDGLRVKKTSITQSHLTFTPALIGHTHIDSLTEHGWQIDDNGTIFSSATYIHNDGQISLGLAPNIVKLDGMNATHRIWVGAVMPADAPFSVTKEGALNASAGVIGGWEIEADRLSSDDAFIDSTIPAIGLGATGWLTGTGFWVGYDTDAYKFFIGDPMGSHLSWDGTELDLTGISYEGIDLGDELERLFTIRTTILTVAGNLAIGSNPFRIYNLYNTYQHITKVFLSVSEAPTDASIIVDVNINGVSIFTDQGHRPSIATSQETGYIDLVVGDTQTWSDGDYITIDVDQVGSTVPGANLAVHIITNMPIMHI
jgi:EAL domain-containing protein (putative c-di-GMP-specific phosphodiesterase class I)